MDDRLHYAAQRAGAGLVRSTACAGVGFPGRNVVLFRSQVVGRLFGRYVQEQLYFMLIWAIPVLALTMAAAILLVALV
jgi:hypothetical protein